MTIKLEMSESDIVRSMKNTEYSPIQLLASRNFKEQPKDVEVNYDSIVIWDDSIDDYRSYKYCKEDINNIKLFLDEWHDYADGYLIDFALEPISFCIEQKR